MTESRPTDFEQARQFHRMLNEKVLDKACSDPQWKQLLIDEPDVAMRESGIPEVHQILEARQAAKQAAEGTSDMAAAEVEGHSLGSYAVGDSPKQGNWEFWPKTVGGLPPPCYVWSAYGYFVD